MNFDLNEEPSDCSPHSSESSSDNDSDGNAHEQHTAQIERLRLLETLTASVIMPRCHRPRQVPTEDDLKHAKGNISNNGINCNKWGGLDLIAKALEIEKEVHAKKAESRGGFFDCNICLGMPRDPIVTCCGHLFCWPCFYRVPHDIFHMRECPVCQGEVSEKHIGPVYGGNYACQKSEVENSRSKIPPRPKSLRVEPVRQQRRAETVEQLPRTGLSSTFHSAEALLISRESESNGLQEIFRESDTSDSYYYSDSDSDSDSDSGSGSGSGFGSGSGSDSDSDSDDSVDSVVEISIDGTPVQRNDAEAPPLPGTDLFRSDASAISSEGPNLDTSSVSSIHPHPSIDNRNVIGMVDQGQVWNADDQQFSSITPLHSMSLRRTDLPWRMDNVGFLDTVSEDSFELPSSGLSTRRRSDVVDSFDVDEDGVSREPRRRRLR